MMRFQYWLQWAILTAGAVLLPASQASAQEWEVGAVGGGSFYLDRTVKAASGASGQAGFQPGYVAGGFLAHNTAGRLGGEIRYLFENADMRLSSGGTKYTFGARAHLVHYDLVIHANAGEDRVRPFVAIGGGMKGYFGVGTERAVQPLSNLAILSRTSQWQPMVSVGAGIKCRISSRLMVRVEVRDYFTRVPKDVLLPSPGASLGGWLHDIMPMASISYILP
jgi:hypothetical protein